MGKGDEEVYRGCSLRSGTVATGQCPDDPWLDPGGVLGRLVLAGEHQRQANACKLKAGLLSTDRVTLDRGQLSCIFDSGAISDGIVNMRLQCSDPEEKQPSMYVAQIKLKPDKKIELIMEPVDNSN